MPISKFLITTIFFSILFGQNYTTVVLNQTDSLNIRESENIEARLKDKLLSADQLGRIYNLEKLSSDSVLFYSSYDIDVKIDTIFSKTNDIWTPIINRIYSTVIGTSPNVESNRQFKKVVRTNPFIQDNSIIEYGIYNNKIGAVIDTKTNFLSFFSGLLGASRENGKWNLNGQINVHLENEWRTAGNLDLFWKRLNNESQILNFNFEEPHPFAMPIGVFLSYDQVLRDGNYINNQTSLAITKTVPGLAKILFGIKNLQSNSTAKGDSLGISDLSIQSVFTNLTYDSRNNKWITLKGHFVKLIAELGERTIDNIKDSSLKFNMEAQNYFSVGGKNNVALKWIGQWMWLNENEIHDSELIRFGGVNNLRGYVEDQFKSEWVLISTLEYNINIINNLQVTLFGDVAIQNKYNPLPYGIGLGFTQISKNSLIKLFYGVGRDDSLKTGKLHIQFYSKL